jgi:alpha/beta superfamily hydrolase
VLFRGTAGELEGLWKEAAGPRRGAAVFAHPHPLHGGTMHNKVVYRAVQALTQSGFATLRFQFRGVGLSKGRYDAGRGEVDDVRSALGEAEARGGLPLVAGGFSFGAAMALKASDGDPRVAAFIGLGLPVATESGRMLPRPPADRPSLFLVGERDAYGPPEDLARFLQAAPWARSAVIPGADHFFEGRLEEVASAVRAFLDSLSLPAVEGKAS